MRGAVLESAVLESDVTSCGEPSAQEVATPSQQTADVAHAGQPAAPNHAEPTLPGSIAARSVPPPPARRPSAGDIVYMSKPLERDTVLAGYTYKLKWPASDHAIYVTLNDI